MSHSANSKPGPCCRQRCKVCLEVKDLHEYRRNTKHANNVMPECMLCEAASMSLADPHLFSSDSDSEQLEHALAGGIASVGRKRKASQVAADSDAAAAEAHAPLLTAPSGAESAAGPSWAAAASPGCGVRA